MLTRDNERSGSNRGSRRRSVALVLAGGQSRRMGRDKLSLAVSKEHQPETILEHVVKVARSVSEEVWVLTPPGRNAPGDDRFAQNPDGHVRCLADDDFYQGPLAALALAWPRVVDMSQGDSPDDPLFFVFVVAGDLPGLDPRVLQACRDRLMNEAEGLDAVLTERDGILQPLLGCYRRSAGRTFQTAFANGDKRLLRAIQTLRVETVSSEGRGWSEWATTPVHTPEDYREWLDRSDRKADSGHEKAIFDGDSFQK